MSAAKETGGTAKPRRLRCALVGVLLGAWLLVLGAIGFALLAVLYGWQPERLRTGLEQVAGDLLDHEIRIGRFEGGLLDGLTLYDVSVAPRAGHVDADSQLVAQRVAVRIDPRASLWQRALVLADVEIVGPEVALARTDERGFVLAGWGPLRDPAPDTADGDLPFRIVVMRGRVRDARVALTRDVVSGFAEVGGRLDWTVGGLRLGRHPLLAWPDTTSLQIELERGRFRDHDLGRGRLIGRARGARVQIETLEVAGDLGHVSVEGAVDFRDRRQPTRPLGGRLGATFGGIDLDDWLALPGGIDTEKRTVTDLAPIGGRIEVGIRPGDDASHPDLAHAELDVRATTDPVRWSGGLIEGSEIAGVFALSDRRWTVQPSTVDLPAGRIAVSGRGEGLVAETLDVTAHDLDLAALPASWLPPRRLAGRVDLDLSLHGPLDDPIGVLEISGRKLRVGDVGPGALEIALRARGERKFVLDAFDWTFEPGTGPVAGTRIRSIGDAAFEIGADAFAVRGLALDWTGGSMGIDGGFANGTLQPSHVELDSLDLSVVSRLLTLPGEPQGVVSGRVDVAGDLGDPEITASLHWTAPRYAGLAAERIDVDVATEDDRRTISAVWTEAARVPLRSVARVPRTIRFADPRRWLSDPRFGLELDLVDFDLAWLAPLLAMRDIEPAGHVDGRLAGAGTPSGPDIRGELRIAGARFDAVPRTDPETPPLFGALTGVVVFAGSEMRTEGLRYGDGADELLLDATVGWSGRRAEDLDVAATLLGLGFRGRAELTAGLRGDVLETSVLTLRDFDVAELARGAGFTGRLGGHLTGEFVVRGPVADPEFRTELTWHEPVVAGVTAERLSVEATREDAALTLRGGLERGGRRVLDVDGSLPLERGATPDEWFARSRGWAGDPATRIRLTAVQFPLDWLPILAPGLPLRSDGFVAGTLTLNGADAVPWIEGALSIEEGVFSLATQTTRVGPLSGTIAFEGRRARFDPLTIAAARGRATLAGSVSWSADGIDDVSVRTRFDGYRFDQLGLLQTTLDGSVLAKGTLGALHVSGEIRLGEVRVSFPNQRNPVLKEIRVMGLPENRSASIREGEVEVAGIEDQTTVDVAVVLPKGTWIRGIGLDAEIVGRTEVTKEAGGELHYAGQLQVSHGRYTLQGKRFELDRGVAVFTGGTSPIPDVEIEAHRRASREVTVFAHVSGPADAPTLELTSQPPMDTAEIVSYLFFGRSATVGNRESNRGLGESAASVAGSMLVDSIAPELRNTLRIDEISVTSGDDDEAPAVEIETQVTPDVYLRLVQSFGATADEAVEVRWRFWKDLSLKSKVNRTGTSAIDLLWEFDYWGLEKWGFGGLTPPPPPPFRPETGPGGEDAKATDDCAPPLACPTG